MIELRPSRLLRGLVGAVHGLAWLALAMTLWQLREQPQIRLFAGLAILAALLVGWSGWRSLRGLSGPLCALIPDARQGLLGIRKGESAPVPLALHSWTELGPVVALDLGGIVPGDKPLRLLVAIDQCSAEDWRSLKSTLRWLPPKLKPPDLR